MGKINQGILGGFSGKVGNVVGGSWKGIDYMRVKPASVANPRTEGQVDQRSKFVTVLRFLQPMKDFVKVGFKNYAIKKTQFNSAMSYNLNNAVTGVYPDYAIDYENALVARGGLAGALNGNITSPSSLDVVFSWDDNSDEGNARATDTALLLIYNEDRNEVVFVTEGVTRDAGSQTITVPNSFGNNTVYGFISFISEDGREVANSKYVGSVNVFG